jgi:hypothetical protein
MEHFKSIVAGSDLPQGIKDILVQPRALHAGRARRILQRTHTLSCSTRTTTTVLDRIEKGEAFKAQQTDPAMIAKCNARLNELAIQLEGLSPKEEAI